MIIKMLKTFNWYALIAVALGLAAGVVAVLAPEWPGLTTALVGLGITFALFVVADART
jgi:hypothetical protein